jgi:hypothetical protein
VNGNRKLPINYRLTHFCRIESENFSDLKQGLPQHTRLSNYEHINHLCLKTKRLPWLRKYLCTQVISKNNDFQQIIPFQVKSTPIGIHLALLVVSGAVWT